MDKRRSTSIYFILYLITFFLWLMAKPQGSLDIQFIALYLAQLSALFAAVTVGLNAILSARFRFVNKLFGGLDKAYLQHGKSGKIAFVLMLAHPTFLLIDAFPYWDYIKSYLLFSTDYPILYGKMALTLFIILIVLTIYVRLPYHVWLKTHHFMGLPMLFLALHAAAISSDVAIYFPLRLWILGVVISGIVAYVYKVFLYKYVAPRYRYKVSKVNPRGDITEIHLEPESKEIEYLPGQFVFIKFLSSSVASEEHPFSISNYSEKGIIRFSIKKSGDFTSTLPRLKKGDTATLYGPYGTFGEKVIGSKKSAILIAGGIGITPFLSIFNYLKKKKIDKDLTVFYVFRNASDGVYMPELRKAAKDIKSARLYTHISSKKGRFTAGDVSLVTDDITRKTILLCGPRNMMKDFLGQLTYEGVPRKNVITEDFDLKS